MIASTYKKFALENGLKVANGVAYGDFRGFATTLSEGKDYKFLAVTTKFPDDERLGAFLAAMNKLDLKKEYRIMDFQVMEDAITFLFHDTIGTMKKIREFCDILFPLLKENEASGTDFCNECGMQFNGDGKWKLINGIAFHLHEGCANSVQNTAQREEADAKAADTGTYFKGAVGAFLGSMLGAVVWALVLFFGYFASIIGLLIGWLSKKGYELFHGKTGKGKLAIVIIMCILGVLVGNIGADVITLVGMINDGTADLTQSDILPFIFYLLATDSEYLTATLANIGLGLLFAALGMFGVFKEIKSETAEFKMAELE